MRSFQKTELPRLHDFHWVYAAVVVVLAIFTYLPFLDLPPLPDDYYQAELGQSAFPGVGEAFGPIRCTAAARLPWW